MSIRFAGLLVPGIVQPFPRPSREIQVSRQHFFGVKGESEIRGETGGRTFQFPMLVYSEFNLFPTRESLLRFFALQIGQKVNRNGLLSFINDSGPQEDYPECTLDFAVIRPPGVLHDVAGTLGGKYFCEADFTFRQL